jgi:NAD(P)-dependent dehydrogenase (short-subunit alcohol dehydrogenase family)
MASSTEAAHAGGNGKPLPAAEGWHDRRLDLSTRIAVVTGGDRGIGRATCIRLALEGIKAVAVVDMSDSVAEFASQANERLGRTVMAPFKGDVTDGAFRRRVFKEMEASHGPVSICIPAAGITKDRLAVHVNKETGEAQVYDEADFRRVLEVDLTAPIYWALETIASVARDRWRRGVKRWTPAEPVEGCIIFIGSVSSAGNKGQISYATAKAGLEGAQATLATEAIFHGVRSAIIHPGYTDTAMVRSLGDEFIREHILPHTQLGRLIHPEEIAHSIVFMIRNAAVSGQLWADAGWHPAV